MGFTFKVFYGLRVLETGRDKGRGDEMQKKILEFNRLTGRFLSVQCVAGFRGGK